jgi:predicted nucleic acid-binding protein
LSSVAVIIFARTERRQGISDERDPPAVAREITPSLSELPSWVAERQPLATPQAVMALDAGEREAIALAIDLSADAVILDDRTARKSAARLGLTVVGSVGLLLEARRRGHIEFVRPDLEAMIASGLFVSDALYRQILSLAGETD